MDASHLKTSKDNFPFIEYRGIFTHTVTITERICEIFRAEGVAGLIRGRNNDTKRRRLILVGGTLAFTSLCFLDLVTFCVAVVNAAQATDTI